MAIALILMRITLMNKLKLQIGEFSKLCGVTVKTLRHYEKLGLVVPDSVDEWSGYRYYCVDQMQQMQTIRTLKTAGFSLEEIGDLLDSDTMSPSMELLEAKIRQTEAQLREMVLRRDRLQSMLNSQKKYNIMDKFSIQSIPAMTVASHRSILPNYASLGDLCVKVIGPEMARLGCECTEPGYCFTFEHDKEYRDHDIDIEYCEQVKEARQESDIIKFRHLPEIPTALCMKVYGSYDRLYQAYLDMFAYMEKEGYRMVGAPRTNYVDGCWNQSDPEKWLTIIQTPVEKIQPVKVSNNRLKIYCCPTCGNIVTTYGNASIECCGKALEPVPMKKAEEAEKPTITETDGEYLLHYNHPMTKEFYIAGIVAERYDGLHLTRLFPEQDAEVRLPQVVGTKIYTIYRQHDKVWSMIG